MNRPVVERIARLRSSMGRRVEDVRSDEAALALRLVRAFEGQGSGWFWETDRAGCMTYLSPRLADVFGKTRGEQLTQLFRSGGGAGDPRERTLGFQMHARTAFTDLEVHSPRQEGRSWSMSGRPIVDELGQFRGFAGSGCDLTAKQRAEAEVTRLALFDPLTGLANRTRIQHALEQSLARRGSGRSRTALLLLDLDRFKSVNDTLGHQVGDILLKKVAERLEATAQRMATPMVGRIGGDEFQVLIVGDFDREEVGACAQSVIAALSRPYQIQGSSISIGSSIGIAIAPDDGEDADTLVRSADLALYAAKGSGRGVYRFFQPALLEQARWRKQMEDDLREALVRDQLGIVYQPIVGAEDARITGYEALLRWQHPTRGAVSPADFIPVAEDSGLIGPIGEWVLRTACAQAASWPQAVRLAVNVSPVQFGKPAFPAVVASALAASGLVPDRLELEITEGVFLAGSDKTDATFGALKGLGVRLALDDFGTGYASLGYLQRAPFDKIKIDQSFVRGAGSPGNRNAAIIKAIVTLANALQLETTAEGVEAQDEIALIRELGCSHIQGFVYGKPMGHAGVIAQLASGADLAPVGVAVSRPVRVRMLRTIAIEVAGKACSARLRDLSIQGAMIDHFAPTRLAAGMPLKVELTNGAFTPAIVKWVERERAGIALLSAFDFTKDPLAGQA